MSVIFVFGAGASSGESFHLFNDAQGPPPTNVTPPPLATGFFRRELYDSLRYLPADVERDYREALNHVRRILVINDPLGEGRWATLNLEEVFTTIELDREFQSSESDEGGRLILIRNSLIRYIWRIIAFCTSGRFGENYRLVQSSLQADDGDTVISFNWDLLFDQELLTHDVGRMMFTPTGIYDNFASLILGEPGIARSGIRGNEGLYLKMHGSLNWFRCTNAICSDQARITILTDTRDCLFRNAGIELGGDVSCERCGSAMIPFLIPPLLRKPITDERLIRAIWGHARRNLSNCTKAVVVGFSAAPTDFYAAWLLRSTLGIRPPEEIEIFVVNPQNDPARPDHEQFRQRMESIFPRGYNSDFREFSETPTILQRIGRGQGAA